MQLILMISIITRIMDVAFFKGIIMYCYQCDITHITMYVMGTVRNGYRLTIKQKVQYKTAQFNA